MFYYEKARSIYDFLYGADNIHSVVIYNNLGGLYEQMGDLNKAEEMCLKSLKVKLALNGGQQDNADIARIYTNLTQIKLQQNNIEDALRFI